jgi:hypothetical protein
MTCAGLRRIADIGPKTLKETKGARNGFAIADHYYATPATGAIHGNMILIIALVAITTQVAAVLAKGLDLPGVTLPACAVRRPVTLADT